MFNPPLGIEGVGTLEDEPWQAVSPRYGTQLRIQLLAYGTVLSATSWLLGAAQAQLAWLQVLAIAVAALFLVLIVIWVPRRVRHTRYLLRRLDVHLRTGLLWRRITSVAINRVQHLEITQGPLERSLGLSRLVVYTAGGVKSDLVLPGLPMDTARRLKVQILSASLQAERQDGADDPDL